jgi:hypothetical protein
VDPIEESVIVDERKDEHGGQSAQKPEDLLLVEADKLGVQGSAVDFEDADDRQDHDEPEEGPVEIAEGEKAPHLMNDRRERFRLRGLNGLRFSGRDWRNGQEVVAGVG